MGPSYLNLYREGILDKRVKESLKLLDSCSLCPRECGVDRTNDETGFCRTGRLARIASYDSHFGEESVLVGTHGSGTIFISSCNLLCGFCQNYEISHLNEGVESKPEDIAAVMLYLQQRGCHNINFVTPTHVVPQLLESLLIAVEKGLNIPLVYNTGGYDKVETLNILNGIFDIYMPDYKFWGREASKRFCDASDYPEFVKKALIEMHRQVGDLEINDEGIALKGLLIRHLVMPGDIAETPEIMKFISKEISENSYVNIMDQYRPSGGAVNHPDINRPLEAKEYKAARESAEKAGLKRLDPRDRIRWVFKYEQ
ncbi:radical SAM protein [Thermodesulfobacteriota bacterium]